MHFSWTTLLLQTVNFAVLVWLLQHFLYRPVLKMVDARRAGLDRELAEAQRTEGDAKAQLAALERERAALAAERAAVLAAAAVEAKEATATERAAAGREAAAMLEQARGTLASERTQALEAARHAAVDLGVEVARRVLLELPHELRAQAWLERIGLYLTALPSPERDALVRQLAGAGALDVLTASALSEQAAAAWRARLAQALGCPVQVSFAVDAKLVAGAELHFPNTIVSFSLKSAAQAIRAELERG